MARRVLCYSCRNVVSAMLTMSGFQAKNLSLLRVARRIGGKPHEGRLMAGALVLPCAIGRTGITHDKRESDGATPAGRW